MSKKHVLIIDDDPRNIFALKATLISIGYDCTAFLDAEEALVFLNGKEFVDIILTDMMMPGMDGYAAIPLMRTIETRKGIPIIAVTAQAMTGDREKCLSVGAFDYISKPIDVDKLIHILDKYITA
jgi:CheY-like chemotaxis protein